MSTVRLGRTDIHVSPICLGTMTWGQQNSEAEAHQQLSYALDRGVNFIDTAEMYPVPPMAETQGRTEAYIGTWFAAQKNRDKVILATKVAGPARDMSHIRGGTSRLDRIGIRAALHDSLRRLQTDYVDLYQLHWPDRRTTIFGQTQYTHDLDPDEVSIADTLDALAELVREGKIRAIGLSNETPWGTMRFLALAERFNLPRVASIQNAYNLLTRTFETGLAEIALREDVGLLPYSPLAAGALTGKYLHGAQPEGARMTLFTRFTRYKKPKGIEAIEKYVALAKAHGLDPAQMALAFVKSRAFVTSTIIGATSLAQLKTNIDAFELSLSDTVLAAIEEIHLDCPTPCP